MLTGSDLFFSHCTWQVKVTGISYLILRKIKMDKLQTSKEARLSQTITVIVGTWKSFDLAQ